MYGVFVVVFFFFYKFSFKECQKNVSISMKIWCSLMLIKPVETVKTGLYPVFDF